LSPLKEKDQTVSAPPRTPSQSLPAWKLAVVAVAVLVAAGLGFLLAHGAYGYVTGTNNWFGGAGATPSPSKKGAQGKQPVAGTTGPCYECEQKNLGTP
jgi:hypothetical protein